MNLLTHYQILSTNLIHSEYSFPDSRHPQLHVTIMPILVLLFLYLELTTKVMAIMNND